MKVSSFTSLFTRPTFVHQEQSGFTGTPRLQKGALCQGSLIVHLQYNPETLTRSLTPYAVTPEGHTSDLLRLKGPPTETIQLEAMIDATDDLARQDPIALEYGIYPSLAALEILVYPTSARMILNARLAELGFIEVIPAQPVPTLFVWGPQRVVPVRITQFSITEEQFDPNLNPIRARVSLSLQTLTYQDLGLDSVGGALSMRNHIRKESLVQQTGTLDPTFVSNLTRGY